MIALHQNVVNCQNTLTVRVGLRKCWAPIGPTGSRPTLLIVLTLRWNTFPQDVRLFQMCMTDADRFKRNFILPAPPVGGLTISQDRLDKMKFVPDCTVPIILPSGKDILTEYRFRISIRYTNVNLWLIQSRLGNIICLFITTDPNMVGYPT